LLHPHIFSGLPEIKKLMRTKDILMDLEQLSALQMDSVNGFKMVSERVDDSRLKLFFKACEEESLKMWEELNNEIVTHDGTIKEKGTLKGAINHLWMKLKADALHADLSSIVKNLRICEELNIERYKQVLANEMPESTKTKLETHLQALTVRIDSISSMARK
jgi:uncharacterized protein (TIGR02284 family)